MTNEAQTNIVVAQARKMLPMMKSTLGESIERYAEFFKKSLLNMAEWKDRQFKEYLEKKIPEIVSARDRCPDDFEQGINYGKELAIKQIINELFKED